MDGTMRSANPAIEKFLVRNVSEIVASTDRTGTTV